MYITFTRLDILKNNCFQISINNLAIKLFFLEKFIVAPLSFNAFYYTAVFPSNLVFDEFCLLHY